MKAGYALAAIIGVMKENNGGGNGEENIIEGE